ncbi:MAG: hypothetical protein ACE5PM_07485 [Candidatus Hydrothermarchaeales archaeon]
MLSRIKDKIDRSDIYAFVGYSILTAIFTYPIILKMDYIAGNDADVYPFIWVLWWVKKALLELHTSPYFSNYIFYPSGTNLSFHPLTFFNSLVAIPLQFIFSPVTSYNLLFLFSFVMSGFGAYLLTRYLTKNETASFIAGIIFAFSPFRFAHALGHFNILSTEWIPFYILYLIKTFEEKPLRNAAYAALFLVLVSLSSWYYMMFMFVFTFIYLIYKSVVNRSAMMNKQSTQKLFILSLLFGILILPFAYPMIKIALFEGYMRKPIDSTFIVSGDLIAFFIPAEFHPIFGSFVKGIYSKFTGNRLENNIFLGYSVLFLAMYAVMKLKRKEVGLWVIEAVAFFVLTLGPALHILGRFIFPSPIPLGGVARSLGIVSSQLGRELLDKYVGIPLPYLFLYLFVPFFSISRTPARFGIMVMLSLAVLAGYGISTLLDRFKDKRWRGLDQSRVFAFGLSALILFEFLAIPFPMVSSSVPDFYLQLSKDKRDYAITEVPLEPRGERMYYATIHNKRILWAYLARYTPESMEFVESVPLLKKFQCVGKVRSGVHQGILQTVLNSNPDVAPVLQKYIESGKDIYSYPDESCEQINISKGDIKVLRESNIRYIIVDKSYPPSTLEDLSNIFDRVLDDPSPIYEDGEIIVFKVY